MHKNFLTSIKFLFTGVLGLMVLFTGTEAIAQPLHVGLEAPRICTLGGKKGTLEITMGYARDINGNPLPGINEEFPRTVVVDGIQRSAFDIRWKWIGLRPSQSLISFSSDRTLFDIIVNSGSFSIESPVGSGDDSTGAGKNAFEQVTVRINSELDTTLATLVTDLTQPTGVTGGGRSGKFKKFCLLEGPGAGQGFAQSAVVFQETVTNADGEAICVAADPQSQCKRKVDCVTGEPDNVGVITTQALFTVDGAPAVSFSVPGLQCPTFNVDDGEPGTRYYCSGGFCFPY